MDNSSALITIGAFLLVLGIVAVIFTTTQSSFFGLYNISSNPYEIYAIPLFIGGILLIVVGAAMTKNNKSEPSRHKTRMASYSANIYLS